MARSAFLRVVAFVLALVATASCTGSRDSASPDLSPGAGATDGATALASPTGNPLDSSPVPSVTPSPGDVVCEEVGCGAYVVYSSNTGEPGGNYIRARTTSEQRWGPGCETITAGADCYVGWQGTYTVLAGDAYLVHQAWPRGAKEPVATATLGPLPGQNSFNKLGFRVRIPKASAVAFRLILLNEQKKAIAISDAYSYRVNCLS